MLATLVSSFPFRKWKLEDSKWRIILEGQNGAFLKEKARWRQNNQAYISFEAFSGSKHQSKLHV